MQMTRFLHPHIAANLLAKNKTVLGLWVLKNHVFPLQSFLLGFNPLFFHYNDFYTKVFSCSGKKVKNKTWKKANTKPYFEGLTKCIYYNQFSYIYFWYLHVSTFKQKLYTCVTNKQTMSQWELANVWHYHFFIECFKHCFRI